MRDHRALRRALDDGADPNGRIEITSRDGVTGRKWMAPLLTGAVTLRNDGGVRALLDRGADVEGRDDRLGQTPIMWLVEALHDEEGLRVLKTLIEYGADVNAKAADGRSALDMVALRSRMGVDNWHQKLTNAVPRELLAAADILESAGAQTERNVSKINLRRAREFIAKIDRGDVPG